MKKRIVDNTQRPAQPEPGEDPAVEKVPKREQGTNPNPKRRVGDHDHFGERRK